MEMNVDCGCYGAGYADGKAKAYEELRDHIEERRLHAATCACDPCGLIRAIRGADRLEAAEGAAGQPSDVWTSQWFCPKCDVEVASLEAGPKGEERLSMRGQA